MTRINYNNSKIYRVINSIDDYVYIGATVEPLTKMLIKHRHYSKVGRVRKNNADGLNELYQKMNELGYNNFYIELLEDFKCGSKEELNMRLLIWKKSFNDNSLSLEVMD